MLSAQFPRVVGPGFFQASSVMIHRGCAAETRGSPHGSHRAADGTAPEVGDPSPSSRIRRPCASLEDGLRLSWLWNQSPSPPSPLLPKRLSPGKPWQGGCRATDSRSAQELPNKTTLVF